MDKNLTDITVVVDRSGSMHSCRSDAEGGLNAFIDAQKEQEGECNLTLVQFDDKYEFVHRGVPIKDVPKFNLEPRGSTALLDALGQAINVTGIRLKAMAEEDRPGLVIFVVVTDGEENASREFKLDQLKGMIEAQQNGYNWQFTYLGANQDAFQSGSLLGFHIAAIGNYNTKNTKVAYANVADNVSSMRCAIAAGRSVTFGFTDEQRDEMA